MRRFAVALALLLAGVAQARTPSYFRDIRPLIESHCLACHVDGGVAFSLEDPQRAYDLRAALVGAVSARRMPPWMAAPGHQRYRDDFSLADAEVAVFERWRDAGYPRGRERRGGSARRPPQAFHADVQVPLEGSRGFLPDPARSDDYRCFVARWPLAYPAYVTGIGAIPGNARIAHHAIIYIARGEHEPLFRAFVDAEGGQSYRCYGGLLPDRLADPAARAEFVAAHAQDKVPADLDALAQENYWLAHWAPGMEGYSLPPGTGIPVRPGSTVVVQMHYFTGFAPREADAGTSVQFQVARQVDKPAMNWPLSRAEWLQGKANQTLVVPAGGRASVSTAASFKGLDQYIAAASGRPLGDFDRLELHSVNVHMHLIGAAGRVRLLREGGEPEVLLDIPRYQFGWQRDFFLAQPKAFALDALDAHRLEVWCEFANPGREVVYGGYGSQEEMCYNFSLLALSKSASAQPANSAAP